MELPRPHPKAIILDTEKLYACLATHPIAKGHTVVVWKRKVTDLHLLSKADYDYLMDTVDLVRNALLKTLNLKKVYLVYVDEANQVHWHLIPRFNEKGLNILLNKPAKLTDYSLTLSIKNNLKAKLQ